MTLKRKQKRGGKSPWQIRDFPIETRCNIVGQAKKENLNIADLLTRICNQYCAFKLAEQRHIQLGIEHHGKIFN